MTNLTRRTFGKLSGWLFSLLFFFLLLEFGSLVAVKMNLIPAAAPSYRMPEPSGPFMGDIEPHFGVWHYNNREYRHTKGCFDVEMRSNSYGAVDKERSRHSTKPRVVVLGGECIITSLSTASTVYGATSTTIFPNRSGSSRYRWASRMPSSGNTQSITGFSFP